MSSPVLNFDKKRRTYGSFWDFIREKHLRWFSLPIGTAGLLAAVNVARQLLERLGLKLDAGVLSVALYAVITVTLVVLLALLHRPIVAPVHPVREDIKRAHRAVSQFVRQWRLLWTIWVIFYLVLGLQRFLLVTGIGPIAQVGQPGYEPFQDILAHALNNAQTVVLYLCYYVITWTSLKTTGQEGDYEETTPAHLAWILLCIVTVIELACTLRLPVGVQEQVQSAFKVFSGFGCGVAMALVVGRLESKYAGAHPVLVFLLYLYALLQMTFLVFGGSAVAVDAGGTRALTALAYQQDAVAVLALFLKVVLFAFVYWLIHSGRLLYYMVRIHELNSRVEDDWDQFNRDLAR